MWWGTAPLLLPPPPSPPSTGIRHFASSSRTYWMRPFEFLCFLAVWCLFIHLEPRKDHGCVRRLTRFTRLHALDPFVCSCVLWLCLVFIVLPVVAASVHIPQLLSSLLVPQRNCWVSRWRRALWTPAHPWRSSAAVPCPALICSARAVIKDAGGCSSSQKDHVNEAGMCSISKQSWVHVISCLNEKIVLNVQSSLLKFRSGR